MPEEEFREVMSEGLETYIRYRKKQSEAEDKEYERERQEERIKELEVQMRENKDIVL